MESEWKRQELMSAELFESKVKKKKKYDSSGLMVMAAKKCE